MQKDPLLRIEEKLDALAVDMSELRTTTAEFGVGQAMLERSVARLDRERSRLEETVATIRDVADAVARIEGRVARTEDASRYARTRLDDHEQRIAALEAQARGRAG